MVILLISIVMSYSYGYTTQYYGYITYFYGYTRHGYITHSHGHITHSHETCLAKKPGLQAMFCLGCI